MHIEKEKIICNSILFTIFFILPFISLADIKNTKSVENQIGYKVLIQKYFPNYVLLNINDLDPFTRKYLKKNHLESNPFIVNRDFDRNGYYDYALLLRHSKNKDRETLFTIFRQFKAGKIKVEFKWNIKSFLDVFILPIESGVVLSETKAVEGPTRKITLKNPAVHLIYFEKSSVAFYWDEKTKKIESIWTSD